MEFTILEKISTLGLGAVLAFIVLWWKRHDDAKYAESLKNLVDENLKREDKLFEILKQQTETMQSLKSAITSLDLYIKINDQFNTGGKNVKA